MTILKDIGRDELLIMALDIMVKNYDRSNDVEEAFRSAEIFYEIMSDKILEYHEDVQRKLLEQQAEEKKEVN